MSSVPEEHLISTNQGLKIKAIKCQYVLIPQKLNLHKVKCMQTIVLQVVGY